jgi:hypothetical protein
LEIAPEKIEPRPEAVTYPARRICSLNYGSGGRTGLTLNELLSKALTYGFPDRILTVVNSDQKDLPVAVDPESRNGFQVQ